MIIGVPKEIKNNEFRVGLTPSGVNSFINNGHKILIQKVAAILYKVNECINLPYLVLFLRTISDKIFLYKLYRF